MGRILLFSIRRMWKQHRGVWLMMLSGMVVSCLSLSIIFGYVSKNYYNEIQFGSSSSLTLWFGEDGISQTDANQLLEKPIMNEAENILFISEDKESCLIGWKGFSVDQWFPHSTGRFFTQEEEENGELVAYVHQDQYDASNRLIENKNEKYYVVGAGFLEAWNIYSSISDESPQTIFSMEKMNLNIVVFPYKTYLKKNMPKLVIVHFKDLTRSKLKERKQQLEELYPNAIITLPRADSDAFLNEQIGSRGKIAALLIVIIGITLVQLLVEWINGNKKQYFIWYQCGVSKLKILALVISEWVIELCVCNVIASGIHWLLLPLLTILGADTLPIRTLWIKVMTILVILSIGIIAICFQQMSIVGRKKNG